MLLGLCGDFWETGSDVTKSSSLAISMEEFISYLMNKSNATDPDRLLQSNINSDMFYTFRKWVIVSDLHELFHP